MAKKLHAYSLGYERLTLDLYVEELKKHGISVVLDVRETPWSYKPGFSRKPLSERLADEGIDYVHIKAAGNPSKNRKQGLPSHEVIELYREHLDSDPSCLEQITEAIEGTSQGGAVCLLCFERDAHDCHRKVILDRLSASHKTLTVRHLAVTDSRVEQARIQGRIPNADYGKRSGKQVEVSEYESRLVAV